MGALYLAVTGDAGLERLLVIKTVLPHLADSEYLARFRDEAKVVVKLGHGNLIPVFDAGQVDGELFLAMEFVEGKDLRAVWNRCAQKGVAFPVDVAVYLTKELARGLGYAHGFGDLRLVHRDVSPPNVLISYAGEVKLTDFGLASSTLKLEKTAPGIIYGKVSYMSPEQARGETLDGRSDLYAAGIILWELLTGRQLFPPGKEQPTELLKRARSPLVEPPSARAPRVPPALDNIVLRALASDRDQRFPTGEELRDALGGWLAAESPATDASRIERFLHMLFEEDIARERAERRALIEKTRDRARKTLPPTDELRRILEKGLPASEELMSATDRRRDEGPNMGRRAADDGQEAERRRQYGRRQADKVLVATAATATGTLDAGGKPSKVSAQADTARSDSNERVAVDVPQPGPGGRTVVTDRSGAAAAAVNPETAAKDSEELIGHILDERYRIVELIGEGGMGRVFAAEHVEIGKRVAVKVLHPVYSRMPDLVERFRREARAASRIGHPHIVDVTDSGTTDDGSVYFVMEYLEGVELAAVIDREGALEIGRSLAVATQICRALAAAHAVGIIHRDLKPENVFLTVREGSADFVKVLDFGIAKSSEAEEARSKRLTHPGMAMGTPEYMAPEQAAGKQADERCDVYAVGAILYEMITGVPPYEGENFMEILTKKATVDPEPPRTHRPDIPEPVEALIQSAMARSPSDRPPSMEALEYELTKALSGRGAAVAKVLGMQKEAAFLAGLGQGHVPFDEATPTSTVTSASWRSQLGKKTPVPGTESSRFSVASLSGPHFDEADSVDTHTEVIDRPVPDLRSGGGRLVGWAITLLLLGAAAGALFLVLDAERTNAPKPEVTETSAAGTAGDSETDPSLAQAGDAGPGDRGKRPGRGKKSAKSDGNGGATTGGGSKAQQGKSAAVKTTGGVPQTVEEADQLLAEAQTHRDKLEWNKAADKYQLVVSGKFHRSAGYLGLAEVAFQDKRADDVMAYARRAGNGIRAQILLGHANFQKRNYAAALEYYEKVLARDKNHAEARSAAKAAREKLGK